MPQDFSDLPFVEAKFGQATSLWNVAPTTDYESDNRRGADYADALHAFMSTTNDTAFLCLVTRSIMRSQQWSGVEIGFFNRLGELSIGSR